jgi:hypothetical protein
MSVWNESVKAQRRIRIVPKGKLTETITAKLFFILTTVFLFSVQPLFSAELTILTENLPPLNYLEENILVGPSVDIVKEIQRRVGSFEQITVYPWVRAYKMALEEENVVLFRNYLKMSFLSHAAVRGELLNHERQGTTVHHPIPLKKQYPHCRHCFLFDTLPRQSGAYFAQGEQ